MLFFQTIIFYFIGNFDEIPYEIKNFKKISTHLLTVLTIGAILKSVIRNYLYKTQPLRVTFLKSRGSCVLYIRISEWNYFHSPMLKEESL